MIKILVLCTGNSCRSQMAEGYLRYFAGDKAEVYSAGIEKHGLNPLAVKYMLEDGIDISYHTSNLIEDYQQIEFDYIITVCDHAKENCPVFISDAKKIHQNFSDPSKVKGDAAAIDAAFKKTRSDIKIFCEEFIQTNF